MAFCSKCGKILDDGASYCSHCGAEVTRHPSEVTDQGSMNSVKISESTVTNLSSLSECTACGAAVSSDAHTCPRCGKRNPTNLRIRSLKKPILVITIAVLLLLISLGANIWCNNAVQQNIHLGNRLNQSYGGPNEASNRALWNDPGYLQRFRTGRWVGPLRDYSFTIGIVLVVIGIVWIVAVFSITPGRTIC